MTIDYLANHKVQSSKLKVNNSKFKILTMKKQLLLLTVAVVVGCSAASAAVLAEPQDDGKYCLKVGSLSMTIDAQKGGKILSLKDGDAELISQLRWPFLVIE